MVSSATNMRSFGKSSWFEHSQHGGTVTRGRWLLVTRRGVVTGEWRVMMIGGERWWAVVSIVTGGV